MSFSFANEADLDMTQAQRFFGMTLLCLLDVADDVRSLVQGCHLQVDVLTALAELGFLEGLLPLTFEEPEIYIFRIAVVFFQLSDHVISVVVRLETPDQTGELQLCKGLSLPQYHLAYCNRLS